jgi:hypothetical protein
MRLSELLLLFLLLDGLGSAAPTVEFNRDVFPILSDKCFVCHGPALPVVKNIAWVRNPIDAFMLARLEKEGLRPSPEADRQRLIRRVSLDLTGLPPTPEGRGPYEIDLQVSGAAFPPDSVHGNAVREILT